MEVTYALGSHMLVLAGVEQMLPPARIRLENAIASGAALAKFRELVVAQGGDPRVIDDPDAFLPQARLKSAVVVPAGGEGGEGGYVAGVDAMEIALAALRLGAGRARAEDRVDHAVGISHLAKVGEYVPPGGTLAVIHANDEAALADARARVAGAITFSRVPVTPPVIVDEVIG
jgi:pyrimidine-nucleoside phosphorylase